MNTKNKLYLEVINRFISIYLASILFTGQFLCTFLVETNRELSVASNYDVLRESIHKQVTDENKVTVNEVALSLYDVELEPEFTYEDTLEAQECEEVLNETVILADTDIVAAEPVDVYITPTLNFNDVTELSGTNPETLNLILEDTWLEGYGELFYELEQEHDVNAMFAIGNAIYETGWNKENSYQAMHNNNIYGLANCKFDSLESCIRYYFNLIDESYVDCGRKSMDSINAKYCPPNPNWCHNINSISKKLIAKV